MGRLDEIEKRHKEANAVWQQGDTIESFKARSGADTWHYDDYVDDHDWLIARLREAGEFYGRLKINAADEERVQEWAKELLAKLEASDG